MTFALKGVVFSGAIAFALIGGTAAFADDHHDQNAGAMTDQHMGDRNDHGGSEGHHGHEHCYWHHHHHICHRG